MAEGKVIMFNGTFEQTFRQVIAAAGGEGVSPPISVYFDVSADTFLRSDVPNTNYSTNTGLYVGESNLAARIFRSLVQSNVLWLPASAVISSATLKIYCSVEFSSNNRTLRIYRVLRNVVVGQATWNSYSTGNPWQTAGGFGALDCEQTAIASRDFLAAETLDEYKTWTFSGDSWTDFDLGNGWLIKADTETDDQYGFISLDNAANKPLINLTYTVPVSLCQQFTGMGDSKSLDLVPRWPPLLTNWLNITEGDPWAKTGFVATSGATVASKQASIDADLLLITVGSPNVILCNLGANDVQVALPAEATWEANYLYILDAMRAKWPSAIMYVTKVWVRGFLANCNTIAGWIDTVVASRSWLMAGDDERIWLEGGDNGVTMTTDGLHYSAAGFTEKVQQAKTLMGY